MRNLAFVLFLVFSFTVKNFTVAQEIVKSKDDLIFHTPDKIKFSDIGKISEFKGVIERIFFTSADLKMVDLYQFQGTELKVNKELCNDYLEKIFALKKSKLFKLKTFSIVDSTKGNVCKAHISEKVVSKKKTELFHRLVYIGFVNTKSLALVFHPNTVDENILDETSKFWNSLR